MPLPKNSKIIVGVSGGIAAYKACEFVRLCKKNGHQVRVVLTANAESFVTPLTFHSLSGEPVLRSLRDGTPDLSATSHIDLAQWGDIFVVAPATANCLAKLANGLADDALSTEALAFQGPLLIAPAMNTRMWDARATQENFYRLQARKGVHFVGPVSGDLACGETGVGKMAEPQEIFAAAEALFQRPLEGKKVLVTSGPTRSYIDSVRFLTNRSSGKMGHSIAMAAEKLGAEVILVTGPVEPRFASLPRGKVIEVETGDEMLAACLQHLSSTDAVFATAAVADFKMPQVLEGKMRREGKLQLEMDAAVDVLAELGKRKGAQVFFGFAAEAGESEAELERGWDKLRRKNLDFLALNNISRKDIGFDVNDNEVVLLSKDGQTVKLPKRAKSSLAETLVERAFSL